MNVLAGTSFNSNPTRYLRKDTCMLHRDCSLPPGASRCYPSPPAYSCCGRPSRQATQPPVRGAGSRRDRPDSFRHRVDEAQPVPLLVRCLPRLVLVVRCWGRRAYERRAPGIYSTWFRAADVGRVGSGMPEPKGTPAPAVPGSGAAGSGVAASGKGTKAKKKVEWPMVACDGCGDVDKWEWFLSKERSIF